MIGLSLSFCVRDLLEEVVDIKDVSKLITATECTTEQELQDVIAKYKQTYWYKYSN